MKDSEKHFNDLVEQLSVVVFETDLQGIITFINEAVHSVLGYTRDEIIGRPFYQFITPEDRNRCVATAKNVMAGKFLGDNEFAVLKKDGTLVSTFTQCTPIYNSQGDLIGLRGILVKVARDKGVDASIRASEEKYRTLINHIKLGVIRSVPEGSGRFIEVNKAMEEILGYSRQELLSMSTSNLYSNPDDRKEFLSIVMRSDGPISREVKFKKKDGSETLVLLKLIPVKDSQGNLMYLDGIFEDITERKKAEEFLAASEKKYRGLVNNIKLGIVRTTIADGGTVLESNQAFEDIMGYTKEELKAMKIIDVYVYPEERQEFVPQIVNARSGSITRDLKLRRKDGKVITVALTGAPVKDSQGVFVYLDSIVEDITERKQVEEERKQAGEKLQELYEIEKLQRQELEKEAKARGLFIDVLAHELRTPLTPILASVGLLKDINEGKTDAFQKKLTDNIYNSTINLANRLEELLDLARYSRGTFKLKFGAVDLNQFFKEVLYRCKPSLEQRNQYLIEELPGDLPAAEMDASRLEQVISNLLSNASKFSEEQDRILFRVSIDNQELQVDVKDNGIGIPLESQQRLFEAYHRVEQDRQQLPGLGLGLAISKNIIEAHRGRIWVVSQPGAGATFSFRIPLVGNPPAAGSSQ